MDTATKERWDAIVKQNNEINSNGGGEVAPERKQDDVKSPKTAPEGATSASGAGSDPAMRTSEAGSRQPRQTGHVIRGLRNMLYNSHNTEFIDWTPTGDGFVVINKAALMEVAPRYGMNSATYDNWKRSIQNYGFKVTKTKDGNERYRCPKFHRDEPDTVLHRIKPRRSSGGARGTAPRTDRAYAELAASRSAVSPPDVRSPAASATVGENGFGDSDDAESDGEKEETEPEAAPTMPDSSGILLRMSRKIVKAATEEGEAGMKDLARQRDSLKEKASNLKKELEECEANVRRLDGEIEFIKNKVSNVAAAFALPPDLLGSAHAGASAGAGSGAGSAAPHHGPRSPALPLSVGSSPAGRLAEAEKRERQSSGGTPGEKRRRL